MAPDDGPEADGWSIHVPSTGFQTAELEDDASDAAAPSPGQLRAAVRETEDSATGRTD
jgi:hypothetical protein